MRHQGETWLKVGIIVMKIGMTRKAVLRETLIGVG
jgi:hypothetical protein